MRITKEQSGFSLIELTIALVVLTAVLGIAFSLLNRFQQTYRYEEAYADAQRNARFAMARLTEIIRSAGTNPTANTTVNPTDFVTLLSPSTVSGTAVSSGSIQLKSDLNGDSLNTARVTANTDVIVTSENVTVRLDQNSRRLIMDDNTVSPAVSTPIADNIAFISFTDPNGASRTNKSIIVRLVAAPSGIQPGEAQYQEVSYTSTIRLRNR